MPIKVYLYFPLMIVEKINVMLKWEKHPKEGWIGFLKNLFYTTNLSLIPLSRLVPSLFQICLRDSGNVLHWPHPQYSKVQVTLEASPQIYLWDVGHC